MRHGIPSYQVQSLEEYTGKLGVPNQRPMERFIDDWISKLKAESRRFADFYSQYNSKISSKLKNAKDDEDKRDVCVELHLAYKLLANLRFTVQYEPHGAAGPDFSVTGDDDFNSEAKRIRQVPKSKYGKDLVDAFSELIAQKPSTLLLSLDYADINDYARLDESPKAIVDSISADCFAQIDRYEGELRHGETREWIPKQVPWFRVTFDRDPRKLTPSPTMLEGWAGDIPYSGKEPWKFTDLIIDSLHQSPAGSANLVVIHIDSDTHDPEDLYSAINALETHVREHDDAFFLRKGLGGYSDYLRKIERLSAVVVTTRWEAVSGQRDKNLVWESPRAGVRLSQNTVTFLRNM